MAKGINQKLKIIYLYDYIRKNSNYDHPLKREELQQYLMSNDIECERKTIYDDIRLLNLYFGDVICFKSGKDGGYYFDGGEFEIPEIKMLVDSVQSSKFITEKQSLELIAKLEGLTNKYDAGLLQRQVVVQDRVKSKQTAVFNYIGHISEAISDDRTVRFQYMEYNLKKELVPKYEGKIYDVSPICLVWDNENYYLVAYDSESSIIKHYRVDKMKNVRITDKRREGRELYRGLSISSYSKKLFSMYHGNLTPVTIRFSNSLVGVVLDKFGKNTIIIPEHGKDTFIVTVDVAVSKQFFAWLFGFSGECEIISPEHVRMEMKKTAEETVKMYSGTASK